MGYGCPPRDSESAASSRSQSGLGVHSGDFGSQARIATRCRNPPGMPSQRLQSLLTGCWCRSRGHRAARRRPLTGSEARFYGCHYFDSPDHPGWHGRRYLRLAARARGIAARAAGGGVRHRHRHGTRPPASGRRPRRPHAARHGGLPDSRRGRGHGAPVLPARRARARLTLQAPPDGQADGEHRAPTGNCHGLIRRGVPGKGRPRGHGGDESPHQDPKPDARGALWGHAGRGRCHPDGRRHPKGDSSRARSPVRAPGGEAAIRGGRAPLRPGGVLSRWTPRYSGLPRRWFSRVRSFWPSSPATRWRRCWPERPVAR